MNLNILVINNIILRISKTMTKIYKTKQFEEELK